MTNRALLGVDTSTSPPTHRELQCDNQGRLIVSGAPGGGGGGTSDTTEATQLLVKTAVQAIDADVGAKTDAAATTDTGTFSIVALVKRGLQNWTTLLARIPALVSGRIPVDGSGVTQPVSGSVTPVLTSGGHISATTAVSGTGYTAFGAQACKQLTICNGSGVDIGVTVGGAGVEVPVFTGTYMTFFGITNANQLSIRRVDTATVQVAVVARWES
jgi:hypothetical protein